MKVKLKSGVEIRLSVKDRDLLSHGWFLNNDGYVKRSDHVTGRTIRLNRTVFERMT